MIAPCRRPRRQSLLDHGDQDDKQRFMDLCEKMKKNVWRPEVLDRLEKFAEEELRPQLGLD
jgi:hypothetical protein